MQPLSELTEHRGSYERIYRTSDFRDEPRFYRWIAQLLPLTPGWRFLDVACGAGRLLAAIQRLRVPVQTSGLDISDAAVAITTGMFDAMAKSKVGGAEALRRVIVRHLDSKDIGIFAHPAYWAPFFVVGDGASGI